MGTGAEVVVEAGGIHWLIIETAAADDISRSGLLTEKKKQGSSLRHAIF